MSRCQSLHASPRQEICNGAVGDWTCVGRGRRPVRMHRPEQRGSGPSLISADCQRYVSQAHAHLFRCSARAGAPPSPLETLKRDFVGENICIGAKLCPRLIKAVVMSWLSRAAARPEARAQRDLLRRSRGDALLPGGRLRAP